MAPFDAFNSGAAFYSVLAHELVHWSGHESRLARNLTGRFGDESYSAEELIAELGAAFCMADFGLSAEPRPDHASYIASWIRCMRSDNRAIFRAASYAEKACSFLDSLQGASALAMAA